MYVMPLYIGCLINYGFQIQVNRAVGKNPSSPHASHPIFSPCLKHLVALCSSGWFDLEFISNNWCAFWNLFKQCIVCWVAKPKRIVQMEAANLMELRRAITQHLVPEAWESGLHPHPLTQFGWKGACLSWWKLGWPIVCVFRAAFWQSDEESSQLKSCSRA